MMIDASYAGHEVRLELGQVAVLKLPENPTTGYRWTLASEVGPACRLDDAGFQGPDGPPGRGGEHVWNLAAVADGACALRLVYARSFAPGAPGDRAFSLDVKVTKAP